MERPRKIVVGVDYDGVVIPKAFGADLARRATKMALGFMDDAAIGIRTLQKEPDVVFAGIRTVRPEWLRKGQTRRGLKKLGFEDVSVVHSGNSMAEKIVALLETNSDGIARGYGLKNRPSPIGTEVGIDRFVLIDDSYGKVMEAIDELGLRYNLKHLLKDFTLAAFGPKTSEGLRGHIRPDIGLHVVQMRGWRDLHRMLDEVRMVVDSRAR